MRTTNDIQTISICDLLERIYPGYWDGTNCFTYLWEERNEAVKEWCVNNNAYYYGRSRENFYVGEAIALCEEAGKEIVVLEDFS